MKEVLTSSKKSLLALFMILMLAATMVGCSKDEKSDKDNAKDKAKEYVKLVETAQIALGDAGVNYEGFVAKIIAADTQYAAYEAYVVEKQISAADQDEIEAEFLTSANAMMQSVKDEKTAIDAVRDTITGLGEITLEKKSAVESARAAYDAVDGDGKKAKVADLKETLEAAETALAGLVSAAVENVNGLITAMPEATAVTVENLADSKAKYEAAQAAYDALPESLKAQVANADKLAAVKTAIEAVEKDIVEVMAVADVTISAGVTLELPANVTVKLGNGTEVAVAVVWDLAEFNNKVEGQTTVSGVLTTTEEVTNTKELKAMVKVIVTADVTAPVITLNGNTTVVVKKGETYEDAGATAVDGVDGTVEVTTVSNVDTAVDGTYTVTYTAIDVAGNAATAVTRTVIVDGTAPVITMNGTAAVTIDEGTTYADAGATAEDNVDGTVTVTVQNNVNAAVAGVYTVVYTAVDMVGNTATATRTVTVVGEITAPAVITVTSFESLGFAPFVGYRYLFTVTTTDNTVTTITVKEEGVSVVQDGRITTAVKVENNTATFEVATTAEREFFTLISKAGDAQVGGLYIQYLKPVTKAEFVFDQEVNLGGVLKLNQYKFTYAVTAANVDKLVIKQNGTEVKTIDGLVKSGVETTVLIQVATTISGDVTVYAVDANGNNAGSIAANIPAAN